tara:strand:- start:354 stop:1283 length:930 start_codon:yes stop_codon:yes gene_type:complete
MSNKFKVLDYDVIYLSYDEPNAEENYADLLTKVPWAKRIHGVHGSDAAHKACAELSETDRFITVDGDNKVKDNFLKEEISFEDDVELENCVISWAGKNAVNGLVYGNGGLKCWPKEYVLNMRTHENADPTNEHAQVDFCWDLKYVQMNSCFSDVYNNGTPQQAWRAGFREGVKLSLNQGIKPDKEDFLNLHWRCLHWMYIWAMVGADIKNGDWAILGTRAGVYKTMCTEWDYVNVRDFEYLNNLWEQDFATINNVTEESINYGKKLINELQVPIDSEPFTSGASKFFKTIYQQPDRVNRHKGLSGLGNK